MSSALQLFLTTKRATSAQKSCWAMKLLAPLQSIKDGIDSLQPNTGVPGATQHTQTQTHMHMTAFECAHSMPIPPRVNKIDLCLSLSLYVCIYIYIYIISTGQYVHACMHVRMRACTHVLACMNVCMHTYTHAYVHGCMHACTHAHMYACMYACM